MRAIFVSALLAAALVPIGAHAAADAPPPAAGAPSRATAPAARTVKPDLHVPAHRTRRCTVTRIRVREGTHWVKRTRRTCN